MYVVRTDNYKCFTDRTKWPDREPYECETPADMLLHLMALRGEGLRIPGAAITRLRKEIPEVLK